MQHPKIEDTVRGAYTESDKACRVWLCEMRGPPRTKSEIPILRFSNFKSQSFQGNKFPEIDLIIEQILYLA